MKNEIQVNPHQNKLIFTEAVADILDRINKYSFNVKYLLTLEFTLHHKSANDLAEYLHHVDRVLESFIHRNKKHTDTPGRIYFIEPHADRGFHVHIVLEQLPFKVIEYYAGKSFLLSSKIELEEAEKEARAIEMLGARLRKYVNKMSKSKRAFNSKNIFDIDGLTRYLNKTCFDPRVAGVDHIDILNSSIFNPKWIENRLNTMKGAA